ncbi:hypothetical protein V8B97DRAFT_2010570 [Scleroderma yunnanense]
MLASGQVSMSTKLSPSHIMQLKNATKKMMLDNASYLNLLKLYLLFMIPSMHSMLCAWVSEKLEINLEQETTELDGIDADNGGSNKPGDMPVKDTKDPVTMGNKDTESLGNEEFIGDDVPDINNTDNTRSCDTVIDEDDFLMEDTQDSGQHSQMPITFTIKDYWKYIDCYLQAI